MTAKTTMTIAQILFILAGIGLGFWLLGSGGSAGQTITAGMVSVGLLLFGVGAFVIVQRQGMFGWILAVLRRIGLRIQFLETREQQLLELDRTIASFYSHQRQAFLLSTGLFLLGWLAEALEVYVMVLCMGQSINVLPAVAIGALSVFIKGGTFLFQAAWVLRMPGTCFCSLRSDMARSRASPSRSCGVFGSLSGLRWGSAVWQS